MGSGSPRASRPLRARQAMAGLLPAACVATALCVGAPAAPAAGAMSRDVTTAATGQASSTAGSSATGTAAPGTESSGPVTLNQSTSGGAGATSGPQSPSGTGTSLDPSASSSAAPTSLVRVYKVLAQRDGQPENLQEIADRFLGNKDRASDILALNQNRVQADGKRLSSVDGSLPEGWVLQLPADARGIGLEVGTLSNTPTTFTEKRPIGRWIAIAAAVIAGLLALAALIRWWRRRRARRAADAGGVEASQPWVAWEIDRVVRLMAALSRDADMETPRPYLVDIVGSRASLYLSVPTVRAPLPFRASEDGRVWRADVGALNNTALDESVRSPLPLLVVLPVGGHRLTAVNLAEADGVVQIAGPPSAREAVARDWADQVRSDPWGRQSLEVRAVGNAARIPGAVTSPSLAEAAEDLDLGEPGILFLDQIRRRDARAAGELARSPWVVVAVGDAPQARWTFTVSTHGRVESDLLPDPDRAEDRR